LDGVIRGASLANSISSEMVEGWVGRPWADTVETRASEKVLGMLADARSNGVSDFRRVRQRFPSGLELPIEYNAVRLGGQAGLIAIGKNLQAVADVQSRLILSQHAREQDAWKLRDIETRNRLLFDSSDDPILLLRADDFCVVEANPAAIRAGALDAGRDFPGAIVPRDREAFRAMMAQVGDRGRVQAVQLHIGAAATPWLVRASQAVTAPETIYLLRLSPVLAAPPPRHGAAALEDLIERMPEGFVVVADDEAIVLSGNRAFLDLVQAAAPAAAIGQALGRWLFRPGADATVLMEIIRRHGTARNFATSLQGELGTEVAVEISAVAAEKGGCCALLVRDVSRRQTDVIAPSLPSAAPDDPLLVPLMNLTQQIGATPLLQLLREMDAVIERHCVETALERAGGNRTAAAGLLGLSRQSLYTKLAKYGIHNAGDGMADSD
jgi:transcriptional regulator PpsR